jgi:hypothetical protein
MLFFQIKPFRHHEVGEQILPHVEVGLDVEPVQVLVWFFSPSIFH